MELLITIGLLLIVILILFKVMGHVLREDAKGVAQTGSWLARTFRGAWSRAATTRERAAVILMSFIFLAGAVSALALLFRWLDGGS